MVIVLMTHSIIKFNVIGPKWSKGNGPKAKGGFRDQGQGRLPSKSLHLGLGGGRGR